MSKDVQKSPRCPNVQSVHGSEKKSGCPGLVGCWPGTVKPAQPPGWRGELIRNLVLITVFTFLVPPANQRTTGLQIFPPLCNSSLAMFFLLILRYSIKQFLYWENCLSLSFLWGNRKNALGLTIDIASNIHQILLISRYGWIDNIKSAK